MISDSILSYHSMEILKCSFNEYKIDSKPKCLGCCRLFLNACSFSTCAKWFNMHKEVMAFL